MRIYLQPESLGLGYDGPVPLILYHKELSANRVPFDTDFQAEGIAVGDILDMRRHLDGPISLRPHLTPFMVVSRRLWLNVGTIGRDVDNGLVLLLAPMSQPGMNTGETVHAVESSVPVTMRGDVGANPTRSLQS